VGNVGARAHPVGSAGQGRSDPGSDREQHPAQQRWQGALSHSLSCPTADKRAFYDAGSDLMCVYAPQVPVSVEGIKRQGPGVQLGTASLTNSDAALTSPATANGHSSANRSSAKSSLFTVRLCLACSCSGEVGPLLLLCLPYGAFARSAVGSSAPARARLAAEPLG
jgi:hypothetical protein